MIEHMIVYLCGPMRGLPNENKPAFTAAEDSIMQHFPADDVISPATLDNRAGEKWSPDNDIPFMRKAMSRDLSAICTCSHIALLCGWERSEGARCEVTLAKLLGLKCLIQDALCPDTWIDPDDNLAPYRDSIRAWREFSSRASSHGAAVEPQDSRGIDPLYAAKASGWSFSGSCNGQKWTDVPLPPPQRDSSTTNESDGHCVRQEVPLSEYFFSGFEAEGLGVAIKDSGKRQEFGTGSVRDTQEGKGRFDLLSPYAITRLAQHTQNGCEKYGDRNWEKGQPLCRYIDSALRHLFKYLEGHRDEDHMAAVMWNAMAMIHTEHEIAAGRLPDELNDLPIERTSV